MAVYNTSSDSANTAIRAFLTKVGEYYWGKSFNTGSGNSKKIFEQIKNEVFEGKCAYCGVQANKLQIEHLIMFNRTQYGLHHPGNIVPACQSCNKRRRDDSSNYLNWEDHLEQICRENDDLNSFFERKKRIQTHVLGQDTEYYGHEITVGHDNDFLVLLSSTDRYYTYGLNAGYRWRKKKEHFYFKRNTAYVDHYTDINLNIEAYTPEYLPDGSPDPDEQRPYAGWS